MANLFLIDGATAIWKSNLTKYVSCHLKNSIILKKISNRELRINEKEEELDLKLISDTDFSAINPDFQYIFNERKYGFCKHELDEAIAKHENVFLVIRSPEVINKIRKEFSGCNIVTVFIYTDTKDIYKQLPGENRKKHRQSAKKAFDDYLKNPEMYDEVLVNGSSANDFYRLVNILIFRNTNSDELSLNENFSNTGKATVKRSFQIIMPHKLRAILGLTLGGLATIAIGFLINMLFQNTWSYWKYISTGAAVIIVGILILLSILVILGTDEK